MRPAAILGLGLAILAGCHQGRPTPDFRRALKLAAVSGTVTLDGEPLVGARVVFELEGVRPTRSSSGTTDSAGRYTMYKERNAAGVIPGPNIVRVTGGGSGDVEDNLISDAETRPRSRVPSRYNRRSELRVAVEPNGTHTFDFKLTSKQE